MKKILLIALCVASAACSTSSKNFKPDSVQADEGVFVGNIKVFINGEDLTKHCYVGFGKDKKPYISLDETGTVIGKMKAGPTEISYIICTDYGLISVNHSCEWKGASFTNYGKGVQTYFGDVTLNWQPSGTDKKKATALMFGTIGSAVANSTNSCGIQEFIVKNDPTRSQNAYQEIDPSHTKLKASLVVKPRE